LGILYLQRCGRHADGAAKKYVAGIAHFSYRKTQQDLLIQSLDGYAV
jgi:hypothetical protein